MNYVKVSKNQVIEAIKTESLRPGTWIDTRWNSDSEKVCHVCAVGAVFRSCLSEDVNDFEVINEFIDGKMRAGVSYLSPYGVKYKSKADCLRIAKYEISINKNHLKILSHLFESLCMMTGKTVDNISRHQIYRIKQTLIQFIEENFPKYIEVPVNGFDVKKGLKVFEK
jgi:hypothetical protein